MNFKRLFCLNLKKKYLYLLKKYSFRVDLLISLKMINLFMSWLVFVYISHKAHIICQFSSSLPSLLANSLLCYYIICNHSKKLMIFLPIITFILSQGSLLKVNSLFIYPLKDVISSASVFLIFARGNKRRDHRRLLPN